jgi:hypothetical protein
MIFGFKGGYPHETHFTSIFINALPHHQKCSHGSHLMSMKPPLRLALACSSMMSFNCMRSGTEFEMDELALN